MALWGWSKQGVVRDEAESRLIKRNASESKPGKSKLSQHVHLTEEKLRIAKFNVKIVNAGNQPRLLFFAETLLFQILQWLPL